MARRTLLVARKGGSSILKNWFRDSRGSVARPSLPIKNWVWALGECMTLRVQLPNQHLHARIRKPRALRVQLFKVFGFRYF